MNYKFTNENGRTYGGTAALLHEIKLEGGCDEFIGNRTHAAISAFLASPDSQDLIEALAQSYAKRKKIKMNSCG